MCRGKAKVIKMRLSGLDRLVGVEKVLRRVKWGKARKGGGGERKASDRCQKHVALVKWVALQRLRWFGRVSTPLIWLFGVFFVFSGRRSLLGGCEVLGCVDV